jgi:hypothetical protein
MIDDPRVALPPKRDTYNTIESMIRHFKHIVDGIRVPAGEAYTFVEGGNGELGFFIVADGTGRPYKLLLPLAFVRPSVDGRALDHRTPHRRRRADLRHDQHDRRRVRQVTILPSGTPPPTAPQPVPAHHADASDRAEQGHADHRRQTVTVPKGTNVLEAARTLGIDISAFCYHPGLSDRRAAAGSAWSRSRRTPSCSRRVSRSAARAWWCTPRTRSRRWRASRCSSSPW